jgi:NADP-dependent 3-hydroxy acid dehydrogenase YdfG
MGRPVFLVNTNLRNENEVQELSISLQRQFPSIDILVNVAGMEEVITVENFSTENFS